MALLVKWELKEHRWLDKAMRIVFNHLVAEKTSHSSVRIIAVYSFTVTVQEVMLNK